MTEPGIEVELGGYTFLAQHPFDGPLSDRDVDSEMLFDALAKAFPNQRVDLEGTCGGPLINGLWVITVHLETVEADVQFYMKRIRDTVTKVYQRAHT